MFPPPADIQAPELSIVLCAPAAVDDCQLEKRGHWRREYMATQHSRCDTVMSGTFEGTIDTLRLLMWQPGVGYHGDSIT